MTEKEAALNSANAEIQQMPSNEHHEIENVQPKQDELEWHPQHLHEVVAVAMVVKNWLRPRDRARERAKAEATAATVEVNTSLVFEPMAITVERIRVLRELGRTPSQSSIRLTSGMRSGSKLSSASLNFAAAQMSAAASAGQTPRIENVQQKTTQQNQTAEEAGPTGEEETMQPTVEQVQPAAETVQTVAPVAVIKSNGNAVRGNNRPELTDTNTTESQERALLGHEQRRSVAENLDNFVRQIGREISALPRLAVDPSGSGYACWTFVIYLVFLYNAIMCVLCVFDDTQSDQFFAFWMSMNSICDILNLADLFVNSRLSYMDDGMLIKDWRRLTKRYMRSLHFGLDLAALLPLDLLLILNRSISLARFNRLTKCYRVWQFVQMTNVRTDYPNAFRILHIVVVCLVLFHWNAALYFKISLLYGIFSIDPSAWEFNFVKNQDPIWVGCGQVLWAQIPDGQCSFNESGRGDPDTERMKYLGEMVNYWDNRSFPVHFSNFSKQYSLSFYWSSLTLTTSGQQPYPTAAMHNFLEIFDTIVGVLVFAVIVGSVGNVVTTMNRGRAEIQQLNDGIKFYMNYRNVSEGMQKRVLDCIHYIQRHAQIQNEQETLRQIDLFAECEPSLLYELVLRLRMQMFAPNDFLCRRGDLAKEMYVLKRGVLEVFSDKGEVSRLWQGNAFGEMAILKPTGPLGKWLATRRHSLRSLGYSEVYLLSQEEALEVFADYPEQRQALIQRATEILVGNGELEPMDLEGGGPFSPIELCGTESTMEVLQMLKGKLEGLDAELDGLYAKFTSSSSDLKQQMTALEADYKESRRMQKEKKKRTKKGNLNL